MKTFLLSIILLMAAAPVFAHSVGQVTVGSVNVFVHSPADFKVGSSYLIQASFQIKSAAVRDLPVEVIVSENGKQVSTQSVVTDTNGGIQFEIKPNKKGEYKVDLRYKDPETFAPSEFIITYQTDSSTNFIALAAGAVILIAAAGGTYYIISRNRVDS